MYRAVHLLLALLVLSATLVRPTLTQAAAYGAPWTTSLTVQNLGTGPATWSIAVVPEGQAAVSFTPSPLASGASTSLAVGSIPGLPSSFRGAATITSDQPLAVSAVYTAPGIASRPIANALRPSDAPTLLFLPYLVRNYASGTPRPADQPAAHAPDAIHTTGPALLIPTALKQTFDTTTIVAVQNIIAQPVDITVVFYAQGNPTPVHVVMTPNVPPGTSRFYDLGTIPELGPTFNGSIRVEGQLAGTATPAPLAAISQEQGVSSANNRATAVEGTAASSTVVFMPSALCAYSAARFNSAYAVQNASLTESVSFQVTYSGGQLAGPYTLAPGGKRSVLGCDVLPAGSLGAAVITRTAGLGTLVAVLKVSDQGSASTAALGSTSGAARVALPYVRWGTDAHYQSGARQRAFISIQNVGTSNATNVQVRYIDRDGATLGTQAFAIPIAPGAKLNSTPHLAGALDACGRFGEYGGGSDCLGTAFGGGAIVEADTGAQLAVIVRVSTPQASEDYSGIAFP